MESSLEVSLLSAFWRFCILCEMRDTGIDCIERALQNGWQPDCVVQVWVYPNNIRQRSRRPFEFLQLSIPPWQHQ